MGLLSSSVSITRYKVHGKLNSPIVDRVVEGLKKNKISDIDGKADEMMVGWTSFDNPFQPRFDDSSFVYGTYFVFSLRIDKKNISLKILQKHTSMESAKRMAENGRNYLTKTEKKLVKDHVMNVLSLKIPATPNIYDVIWAYEDQFLWFFTNLKTANEELETLFSKSFKLSLIRLFPYFAADMSSGLTHSERDGLNRISPTRFVT